MADEVLQTANAGQPILEQDSTTTKAEKIERNGAFVEGGAINGSSSQRKRVKSEDEKYELGSRSKRQKGVAPIKAE